MSVLQPGFGLVFPSATTEVPTWHEGSVKLAHNISLVAVGGRGSREPAVNTAPAATGRTDTFLGLLRLLLDLPQPLDQLVLLSLYSVLLLLRMFPLLLLILQLSPVEKELEKAT